jgi:HD-like signal output (HDOD) protein/DNA-binding NarL/FixJ family response regulator
MTASHHSADEPSGCVLVIDDDENIRTLLERQIRRLGYEVLQAGDGLTGLAVATSDKPQVILVDLRMPGIDGHTFLRRLTASGISASVVAMSGQGNMDDVIDVLRAGVIDYLRKPWSVAELAGAVERGFERQQQHQQRQQGEAAPHRRPADPGPAPVVTATSEVPTAPTSLPQARASDPFSQVLARLRGGELPIPAMPTLVTSLRSAVQRANVNLDELVSLIEQDPRLVGDVLRLSNTAHYARGGRIQSIKMAVARIGFRMLHNLVETIFLREFFQARDTEVRVLLGHLWKRSVAHATAMRELAAISTPGGARPNGDTAYLVGLMSDVGASLLLWLADERRTAGGSWTGAASYLPAIQSAHQEVGAALLKQWMADPAVIAGIADHHGHSETPPNDYARMMVVAGELTRDLPGLPPDLTTPAAAPAALVDRCIADLRIDRGRLQALAKAIGDRYQETVDAFGSV